ncbi:hypothetical protein NL676_039666 [Syzygium grande]|nr:hypothetical protein NL676_039666 [Syzygium grande]
MADIVHCCCRRRAKSNTNKSNLASATLARVAQRHDGIGRGCAASVRGCRGRETSAWGGGSNDLRRGPPLVACLGVDDTQPSKLEVMRPRWPYLELRRLDA